MRKFEIRIWKSKIKPHHGGLRSKKSAFLFRASRISLFLLVLSCSSAIAVEVNLKVMETGGIARSPAVITTGVPFGRGQVKEVGRLAVTSGGKPLPAQFLKIASWDDGSVRWALMDVQLDMPAGGKADLVVSDSSRNPAPRSPVKIAESAEAVRLSTGGLECVVSKKKAGLVESIKVDGKELITGAGRGLVVYKDSGGEVVAAPPSEVRIEQAGPMRAVVCLRGKYPGVHNDRLAYTVRLTALAGQKSLKAHVWLENQGAMGYYKTRDESASSPNAQWFAFRGMAVELGLGLGPNLKARCEGAEAANHLKVLQVCRMTHGQEKVQYKKGPFYTWNDFEYTITSSGEELKRGERTDGVLQIQGGNGTLTAAVRDFWQNYEKAMELDGQALRLWLWPTEGQWPRARPEQNTGGFYDKTLAKLAGSTGYLLPGGVHKGHEFLLDFSGRDPRQAAAELSSPLWALASAGYFAETEAAPGLFAPPEVRTADKDCNAKLAAWLRMTHSAADPANATGLFKARQDSVESQVSYLVDSSFWFGWMDFGDLFVPGRGQVGLHYDWTWIMLLSAMRTGDMNFVRLAASMARHRIDVDQLWSDGDPPEARGLQRGDINFPMFHCYRLYRPPTVETNWLAGVVLWHMLTGEPKALECCARNAEGLKAGWAHVARIKPWAGPQTDMAANGWAMSSYCAMYKLTGDQKWLDEALGLFRTNVTAKRKNLGPFLHDPHHQIQSQDYIQEDMKYCYALASFCELHHLTGDEGLMKLLQEGCAQDFPDSFFEAPFFLADLYAYVGLKTNHPESIRKAADLFAQAFPESKCPPVFLPHNSVWSRTSAMMLRSGHLLQYANWKQGTNSKKQP